MERHDGGTRSRSAARGRDPRVRRAWSAGVTEPGLCDPFRRQPRGAAEAPRFLHRPDLHRPAVQHGQGAGPGRAEDRAGRRRGPHGLPGPALPHHPPRHEVVRGRARRLPRGPRAAPGPGPGAAETRRQPVLPHRLPGGALLQGAPGLPVRPLVVHQRDHLGLRLRRPVEVALARQARHHLLVRPRPAPLPVPPRPVRPHPLPGAVARRPREGRAGQDADRHLVAHDRQPHQPREDRVPDAEAARRPRADREGPLVPRRPAPGLLRRQRHLRRGRDPQRPRLHPGRRQPPGDGGDGEAVRRRRRPVPPGKEWEP